MRVLKNMDELPEFCAPVVTVGSFDGVHRGHKHLLDIMRKIASESGGETVVVTFLRHPRQLLEPEDELVLLTSLDQKASLIELAGIDNLVVMPFDERTASMSPEEFVRDILVRRLGVHELVIGYNHRFGKGREGDAGMLRELGKKYGFGVHEATRLDDEGGGKISSTIIRKAVEQGDTEEAERLLGRSFSL
jgi:riboflavin kinase/FMN adenylyltransferase